MATATTCQMGYWQQSNDTFVSHPNSPTGAIINLNDGVTFSLLDVSGKGGGVDFGNVPPEVLKTSNPRFPGETPTRILHRQNRKVAIRLVMGQMATYTAFIVALRNLQQLCMAISPTTPGALKVQVTGSSTPCYFDIMQATVITKYEELLWMQLLDDGVVVELDCLPYIRGARQWLQNLANNAGFEWPGGTGTTVFSETFANFNAYTVQAGGALTASDKKYYPDTLSADIPVRYYRMDETSGTVAVDASNNLQNAQYSNGATFSVTGALTGDTDTAVTIAAASSQRVIIPVGTGTTALPTGNSAISVEGWFKFAANPAANQYLFDYGAGTVATHNNLELFIDTSGKLNAAVGSTAVITTAAGLTTGVYHYCALTWDGTTLSMYVDNAAALTATPGAQTIPTSSINCYIGAKNGGLNFFSGQIDEWAIYGAALSAARVSAHYTAGTTTPATITSSLVIPAAGRVSFGNSLWGAINTWQVKFRYLAGQTATFYPHYTDANNYLAVMVANGTNSFQLIHVVGGVTNTLAQATVTLVNEVGYFLQLTQFPSGASLIFNPYLKAVLSVDAGSNAPGATVATLGGNVQAVSSTAGVSGAAQFAATGAGLAILQNQVSLFGPGGWWCANGTGTGIASGGWQQNSGHTYQNGPVTSGGAATLQPAPAGTLDAYWSTYNPASTTTILATAWPIIASGDTIQASVYLNSTGLVGTSCAQSLRLAEFDASGNLLRTTTLQSVTGNQSWVKLAGSVALGASTAYMGLQLRAIDATSASASGTLTWDNVCWWDQTQTSMATMPYCELRQAQAPFQPFVSGIEGDVPAPAQIMLGSYITTSYSNQIVTWTLARRPVNTGTLALVWGAGIANGVIASSAMALDTTAWGGCTYQNAGGLGFLTDEPTVTTEWTGQFHTLLRTEITGATTPSAIGFQVVFNSFFTAMITAFSYPFMANTTWYVADNGYVVPLGGTRSPLSAGTGATGYATPQNSGTVSTWLINYLVLLPVDGDVLSVSLKTPSGGFSGQQTSILHDGGSQTLTGSVVNSGAQGTNLIPGNFAPIGGGGSNSNVLQGLASSRIYLDPVLVGANSAIGTNVFVLNATDDHATILPAMMDIIYSPCYLQPL